MIPFLLLPDGIPRLVHGVRNLVCSLLDSSLESRDEQTKIVSLLPRHGRASPKPPQ